jgi:hypothetical protein
LGSLLLLLASVFQGLASTPKACPDPPRFWFKVERVGLGNLPNVELRAGLGGQDVTTLSGLAQILLPGKCAGDLVTVEIMDPRYRILYPANGRVTLTRGEEPASVTVIDVSRDASRLNDPAVVESFLRRLKTDLSRASREEQEALLAQLDEYLKKTVLGERNLILVLEEKKRRLESSGRASGLLRRFLNRAEEIKVAFREHAPRAIGSPGLGPIEQLQAAIQGYNPVFNEIREQGEAYEREIHASWGPEPAQEFRSLLAEALAIHDVIRELNDVKNMINDLNYGVVAKAERRSAEERIRKETARLTAQLDERLPKLTERTEAYLQKLRPELLVSDEGVPASPPR